jgi:hypothetical protein
VDSGSREREAQPLFVIWERRDKRRYATSRKETPLMQLVEQHVIDRGDPRYAVIDAAAFASKNLYYNNVRKVAPDTFGSEGVEDGRVSPLCSPSGEDEFTKPRKASGH